ncbi:DUF4249 domain-containing protein [Hymenobacter rubripertinctus]|uniref:DUF4249 domain-containing protein n=1 Tax=Hymenobacter rubripertinctus TaxID=2029981 RepID=A0A418QNK1_9BACT|nr:DUF4249 domain-containing protein [Hymenobacter rubripertinctus]RIY06739.1 DUF4249 domain-containing protein [Hymenobacter rubripertinctus]
MRIASISRILDTLPARLNGRTALAVAAGALLAGCGLQQDIDVVLPAYPPQLVVEAYLENGQIPHLTVSESVDYLAPPTPQVLTDVTATIILPDGQRQVLHFAPGIDKRTNKAYTHLGSKPLAAQPGQTFGLELADTKGRRVTGAATMPARVPIDTVEWTFNDLPEEQRRAYVLMRFRDPTTPLDYYRFQIHRRRVTKNPEVEYTVEDRLNNGAEYSLGTSYEFQRNDTLVVSLYHLDQPYFQFLQSVQDARNANGNPFGQPSAIKSTVQGGLGIFTILSYERRQVMVK